MCELTDLNNPYISVLKDHHARPGIEKRTIGMITWTASFWKGDLFLFSQEQIYHLQNDRKTFLHTMGWL